MKLLLLLVACVFLLLGGYHLFFRPIRRKTKISELSRPLGDLLRAYGDGSVVVARHKPTGRFIQFAKHNLDGEDVLHFGFPDAQWSHDLFADVCTRLAEMSFDPVVRETGESECPRFVDVDGIRSVDDATRLAGGVFEVLGVAPDDYVTVSIDGDLDGTFVAESLRKARHARRQD